MNANYAKRVLIKLGWGLVAAIIALIIGVVIGFAIGGGNPLQAFSPDTWTHILDFLR